MEVKVIIAVNKNDKYKKIIENSGITLLDYIPENSWLVSISGEGMIFKELPYFIPNFEKERVKRKIKFKLIYDKKEVKEFEKNKVKRKMFEGKPFPQGFDSKSAFLILSLCVILELPILYFM